MGNSNRKHTFHVMHWVGLLTLEAAGALAAALAVTGCVAWLKSANGRFELSDLASAAVVDDSVLISIFVAPLAVLLLRASA